MKLLTSLVCLILFSSCHSSKKLSDSPNIIFSDIDNFWAAYDKIKSTQDTTAQLRYFQELYIAKGSAGLDGIIRARRYTPQEYLNAIKNYPLFWASVRQNTLKGKSISLELEKGVRALKKVYPSLKPVKIYLTIGALRTNGTAIDGMLLIGTELAMGDERTVTSELPKRLEHLVPFFKGNPIKSLVSLNIHEYIHTQQTPDGGYDLLSQAVYEGVAEYIPVVALKKPSATQSVEYGKKNDARVKAAFAKEMFSPWIYNWIWNSPDNPFGVRDLGYYMGYAIAEKYYENAPDKKQAIREMIEMDYQNSAAVEAFVDKSGYFEQPVAALKNAYTKSRPTVLRIKDFENGQQNVPASLTQFTVEFSTAMDKQFRSTDFGPLGEAYFPAINTIEFSADGKSATYQLKGLEPNKQYQMVIESGYRSLDGTLPLIPYTLAFKTGQ